MIVSFKQRAKLEKKDIKYYKKGKTSVAQSKGQQGIINLSMRKGNKDLKQRFLYRMEIDDFDNREEAQEQIEE